MLPKLRPQLIASRIFAAGCALLIAGLAGHETFVAPSVFLVNQ